MNKFIEKLTEKAKDMGATKIGFSNLEGVLSNDYAHLKYGITILIRLSDEIINQIYDKPTFTYFHHYRDVNTLIDQICLRISLMIQEEGYLAMTIPASQTVNDAKEEKYRAVFPHKKGAVHAGLGWIGKNDLFITEEYGPRVRLGTILTNMPLRDEKWDVRGEIKSQCGECMRCVNICPAKAIKGANWIIGTKREELIDVDKCAEHMKKEYKDIGRGSVCGLCIRACPRGSKIVAR